MLRIDDIVIFAVLDDAGMCDVVQQGDFQKLGPLHPIQTREAMTHLAYCNLRLTPRPAFQTTMDASGQMWVEARYIPDRFELSQPTDEHYGKLLSFAMQDIPLSPEERANALAGKFSLVFNEKGEFIDIPMR